MLSKEKDKENKLTRTKFEGGEIHVFKVLIFVPQT